LQALVDKGVIERYSQNRGVKHVLSRRYYRMVDKKGAYTRRKGLDRETNKTLLLKHIEENRDSGSQLKDLMQVLPALTMPQMQTLLHELKAEGKIHSKGRTRGALWYPNSAQDTITSEKANKSNTD
jgi:ATP-dependent DNA helicase RecG